MKIIIYARVSTQEQTDSIDNQISLVRNWIRNNISFARYISIEREDCIEKKWKNAVNIEEIVDSGYSGSNMNRPGIKRIMELIKNNMRNKRNKERDIQGLDILAVKDISRIGRNYLEVGKFIEHLKEAGIKLICVNKYREGYMEVRNEDNVVNRDYMEYSDNICSDFDSIIADFYSKDISIKTKSVLDMNKRKGIYSIAKVPFGYRKSKTDKYVIEVYEPEAAIVRFIYDKYNKGESIKEIVGRLNNGEVEEYKCYNKNICQNTWENQEKTCNNQGNMWNYHKVYSILNNEFYKGTMIYGKSKGHIWDGKKRTYVKKKDWIRIENHHKAII